MDDEQPVTCPHCIALDLSWEDSTLIHMQADLAGVDLEEMA